MIPSRVWVLTVLLGSGKKWSYFVYTVVQDKSDETLGSTPNSLHLERSRMKEEEHVLREVCEFTSEGQEQKAVSS